MNVFELRNRLISDYENYVTSFIKIKDGLIHNKVDTELKAGFLWPDPLLQLNPSFEHGETIDELVTAKILHSECSKIFCKGKEDDYNPDRCIPLRLYKHQSESIKIAGRGNNYVLTTGTGSGKSLTYIIPIIDYVLRNGTGKGIKAIVVYPMNALANSQEGELNKFLCLGYADGKEPVTFARYTGQENDAQRQKILSNPPDILLTNYVMLELILTRPYERELIKAAEGLRFLVLDELHTYRGRQGSDVSMLVRRVREAFATKNMQCIGTSATLAGSGNYQKQTEEVAAVVSMIFGDTVKPEHIIVETLKRITPDINIEAPEFANSLQKRIKEQQLPADYKNYINDPLSIWLESTFGIGKESETGRLIRKTPRSMSGEQGAAKELSKLTGLDEDLCVKSIEKHLLGSYNCEKNPETGFPVFAFRLHQFISRGDTIYSSIEPQDNRYLTVYGQQYVPSDRNRILLPLVFCRECGQEYYCVRSITDDINNSRIFTPRNLSDRANNDNDEAGFLYINTKDTLFTNEEELINRLPEDWLEDHDGTLVVRRSQRRYLPERIRISTDGAQSQDGIDAFYIKASFRFCLNCGVAYDARQRSDFTKLSALATEGRSTATTILSLSSIRYLINDESLPKNARKLLSFIDNRQDASLQAGHFNDFIEIGILRSALYKAVASSSSTGLHYDEIVQKVFDAMQLPLATYAIDPTVRYQALKDTNHALRSVIGYRLYRDLKRGWRISAPNLEQCGLLEIKYSSLDELCENEDDWQDTHPALLTASPETRMKVTKTLLDFMRRELAIKVEYLDQSRQEQICQQSYQKLKFPWAIDEKEKLEFASILFPRPRRDNDYSGHTYLSPRGGFGMYLRRPQTFEDYHNKLDINEAEVIINQLFNILRIAGLVEIVSEPQRDGEVNGYQIPASAFLWIKGDGVKPFYDPIRIPTPSDTGGRTNPFFVNFYKTIAAEGVGLEAREHTAQVQYEDRIERENRFREGSLPILYCSPTMELGVDIADLNVVNMRNIPPTPANYAQRSGRAGRSGQPALVFSYSSSNSPHDQYFFKRPTLMVAGEVVPPRLDLSNHDLLIAHIHAIWLGETGMDLKSSLCDILDIDMEGDNPSLKLKEHIQQSIIAEQPRRTAYKKARNIISTIISELNISDWYHDKWLEEVFIQIGEKFDRACDRWRNLYKAAKKQYDIQSRISIDVARPAEDRNKAEHLRREAKSQIDILIQAQNTEADFYTYRYFASEGFLPGYNFPRLPLSAYIPARRFSRGRDEFLSRPRFLAISEFGPRAIIYHEGSRYRINKVIMPVLETANEQGVITTSIKQCESCGYIHHIKAGEGTDLCERCTAMLGIPLRSLFHLQNVVTKREEKINSDEEERLRLGYEVKSGFSFSQTEEKISCRVATVYVDGIEFGKITYSSNASLWRINLGWMHRNNRDQHGFVLDVERGYWARNEQDTEDSSDPLSQRTQRVIPYVEDHKNCLLFEPSEDFDINIMASLQGALKSAIQVEYNLEDIELAAEPMPSRDNRRFILFYEAAEGGAGVLRRIIDDSQAINRIAKTALSLCHFDPETCEDMHRGPNAREDCEAACYDCLMSYYNQTDHTNLDRQLIKDILMQLAKADVKVSPASKPRAEHFAYLLQLCQSSLEKDWLYLIEKHNLRLPSTGQKLMPECHTRPDFLYESSQTAIYVDGPPHDFPERQQRDAEQVELLEDNGYVVIRFHHKDNWEEIIKTHPNIFGNM